MYSSFRRISFALIEKRIVDVSVSVVSWSMEKGSTCYFYFSFLTANSIFVMWTVEVDYASLVQC